jgi:hypothetical protein
MATKKPLYPQPQSKAQPASKKPASKKTAPAKSATVKPLRKW